MNTEILAQVARETLTSYVAGFEHSLVALVMGTILSMALFYKTRRMF